MNNLKTIIDRGFGYYEVNGHQFFSVLETLEYVNDNKLYTAQISYHFNDDVFDNIDCTIEPEETISELYRQSAQDIRDRFDYLILMYSGGADSHQALMSFVKNGIFIDEVRTRYPIQFANKLDYDIPADNPLALIREYHTAAIPGFKQTEKLSPHTKLVVGDYTDEFVKSYNENWLEDTQRLDYRLNGSIFHAVRRCSEYEELLKDHENRKNVAVIYGMDKPKLQVINNKLYFYFYNSPNGGQLYTLSNNQTPFTPIMFYWNRNCPNIIIKQAHLIKRRINKDPGFRKLFKPHLEDDAVMHPTIYPDWDNKWQQAKRQDTGNEAITEIFLGKSPINTIKNNYYNNKYSKIRGLYHINLQHPTSLILYRTTKQYCVGDINAT